MKRALHITIILLLAFSVCVVAQSFKFTAKHLSDTGAPGDRLAGKAEVQNLTKDKLNVTIYRMRNDIPAGWMSSFCLNQCYAPFTDEASEDIPANTTLEFALYFDTVPDPIGTGTVDIRIASTQNPNENYKLTFTATTTTSTSAGNASAASHYDVQQNFPNPFGPASLNGSNSTSIRYSIARASNVSLRVYDMLGHEVKTLVQDTRGHGSFVETWNGTDNNGRLLPSGIYLMKFEAGKYSNTKRLIFLR